MLPMSVITFMLSLVAIATSYLKDRTVEKNTKKVKKVLAVNYAMLLLVAFASGTTQFLVWKGDNARHKAEAKLWVARELAKQDIPIVLNFKSILEHSTGVVSYSNYVSTAGEGVKEFLETHPWENFAPESQKHDLVLAKASLANLQAAAAEIIHLSIQYPDEVPQPYIGWAKRTLTLDVVKLGEYLKINAESSPAGEYGRLLGEGMGINLRTVILTSKTVKE